VYKNGWIDAEFIAKDLNGHGHLCQEGCLVFASGVTGTVYPFPDMVKANPRFFEPLGYMKALTEKTTPVLDDP